MVEPPRESRGLLTKAVSLAFWGAGLSMLLAAAVVPGLIVLPLVPLGGFGYLTFCLIALGGDSRAP